MHIMCISKEIWICNPLILHCHFVLNTSEKKKKKHSQELKY